MSENNAYVYGHYKATTGELFYIGKGTGNRAWDARDRNDRWKKTVSKHGVEIKILYENISDEAAFNKEKELIAEIGLENLVNILPGGEGYTSEIAKKNWQDPTYRDKVSKGLKRVWEDTEYRDRMLSSRTFYTDPEWRKKVAEAGRNSAQNPEWRRKNKEANQKRAQDPEWRKKQQTIALKAAQTSEWKASYAAGLVKRANNPEWQRKQVELRAKTYVGLVSPEGVVYKDIYNLAEFARTHNLTRRRLLDVLQKKRNHHKGWRLYTAEENYKISEFL